MSSIAEHRSPSLSYCGGRSHPRHVPRIGCGFRTALFAGTARVHLNFKPVGRRLNPGYALVVPSASYASSVVCLECWGDGVEMVTQAF